MDAFDTESSLSPGEYLAAVLILLGTAFTLLYLLPTPIVILGGIIVGLSVGVYGASFAIFRYARYLPDWILAIPIWLMLLVPALIATLFVVTYDVHFTFLNAVIFCSLLILLFVYWLVVPSALFQHLREKNRSVSVERWPSITVLVPAYNEEGYVGRCIDSFLDAAYPAEKLDVVVIDDGSTDGTFEEAKRHAEDNVTVLRKANGGKHSALNYGLHHTTSELVVGVDADSMIERTALKELVRTYKSKPDSWAVAGNVKVANRGEFLPNVQALEYIVSINMFRRALDQVGLVKVVPGCLGLFRRDRVEEVGGFSGDTVTEDFDLTIELLKRGGRVHYSSRALVRTEVPDTWVDLYNQRLRWLRGSIQTVFKHRRIFFDAQFGLLHRILVPYIFLSIAVVPVLGIVVLGTVVWMALFGPLIELIGIFLLFALLEILFSTLAILIENDVENEELALVRYAPLTVIGYKQLHDMILVKSFVDVFTKSELSWTHAKRARQRGDETTEESDSADLDIEHHRNKRSR